MNPAASSKRTGFRVLTAIIGLVTIVSLLSSCSTKKGPDLSKNLNDLPALARSLTPPEGIDIQDADGVWLSDGTEQEVTDLIAAKARPDERTSPVGGGTFMLYRSGTIWVTSAGAKSAVVLYKSNDRAYSRHSGVLIASSGWGRQMGSYGSSGSGGSSGGSSGGNSFRGGGSGSGK